MKKKKPVTKIGELAGVCTFCTSENIKYGCMEWTMDSLYYPVECLDCGAEGKEWYEVTFVETIMAKEK
jgi:hypothetical protein